MKSIPASEAKTHFGALLDATQRRTCSCFKTRTGDRVKAVYLLGKG
jgi:hypothetical protein